MQDFGILAIRGQFGPGLALHWPIHNLVNLKLAYNTFETNIQVFLSFTGPQIV